MKLLVGHFQDETLYCVRSIHTTKSVDQKKAVASTAQHNQCRIINELFIPSNIQTSVLFSVNYTVAFYISKHKTEFYNRRRKQNG